MITNPTEVNILQCISVSNHMYTLNLNTVLCQLYLNKAGKNKELLKKNSL